MSKKDIGETKVTNAVDNAEEKAETAVKTRNFKKLKYGSMFYIIIALVIAIVVVLNIMASIMSKRSPMKIDITPDSRYELTEQSVNAVKALKKDVDIVVTSERNYFEQIGNYYERVAAQNGNAIELPFEIIPELLDKYSLYAEKGDGSINVKYVDMDKDPDIVNKYKENYSGDIAHNNIIVSSGDRVEVITESDWMNMLMPDQSTMSFSFVGESTITSAIMNVTDANPIRVAFVKTMNGASICNDDTYSGVVSSFENLLLAKNGYDCTDIDIAIEELDPEKYDMVVIYAPSVDFTEPVINKLDAFLKNNGKNGKSMIYVPDYSKTNLPNIDEFLADWSIKVENNLIIDEKNADMSAANIMLNVNDPDAIGKLANEKLPIIAPLSRELTAISKNNEDVVKEVLKSCDESYPVDLKDMQTVTGEAGARTVFMISQKSHSEQLKTVTSSLLVLGSSFMPNNTYLTQNAAYNNANVLLSTINTMTGKEGSVIVPDKNLQQSFITMTTKQARNIQIIVVWVIPFLIAVVGIIVLLRRRNK